MDPLKPIRDLWEGDYANTFLVAQARLSIAGRAFGQSLLRAFREDWPGLLALGAGICLAVLAVTYVL
jgi:hypothetical protein